MHPTGKVEGIGHACGSTRWGCPQRFRPAVEPRMQTDWGGGLVPLSGGFGREPTFYSLGVPGNE